jgi:hypothetical protein
VEDSQEKVFLNIDKVHQERKKILKSDSMKMKSVVPKDISSQIGTFDFSQIVAYDKETKLRFVIDSSLDGSNGGIIMQTPHMRTVLKNSQTASQTDSVKGFLYDPNLSSVNLAIISTVCHVREKWVATMYAILFGKTAGYFRNLLEGYGFKSFDEFSENYMGMVCDFSDAERKGFKAALEKHFGISLDSYNVETFYAFCLVHFDRSACRIYTNHAIVPLARRDEFKEYINKIKVIEDIKEFNDLILIIIKTNFPKCKKWLDWYLHSDRARILFPARGKESFVGGDYPNTNAEESMGMWFSYHASKQPTIPQLYLHLSCCHQNTMPNILPRFRGIPLSIPIARRNTVD